MEEMLGLKKPLPRICTPRPTHMSVVARSRLVEKTLPLKNMNNWPIARMRPPSIML